MKIRTIIVDDEPLARKGIINLLSGLEDIQIVGECDDGFSAVEQIDLQKPDLIFLDIQMPEMNGFEVLSCLEKDNMPFVVFITAYDEYAIKAFQVHALDYLLKPVNKNLFNEAVDRARILIKAHQHNIYAANTRVLLDAIKNEKKYLQKFVVRKRGKLLVVPLTKIILFQADGDYVILNLDSEKHLVRETLINIENQLDPNLFVRINRSTLVRVSMIKELKPISKGDYEILLINNIVLKLSRTYRTRVMNLLKNINF